MKISVIMPCHNAGRWIDEALESVAAQSYQPHEVIVVDDNSSDDSASRAEAAACKPRVLKVDLRNAAAARNVGIEQAEGDWIAFLDADDTWYPHHLADARAALEHSGNVAYMASADHIDMAGQVTPVPGPWQREQIRTGLTHMQFLRPFVKSRYFAHSTVLLHRERTMAVGGFDAELKRRHDFELFMRVILDHTWAFGSRPDARWRCDTPGSISRNRVSCQYFMLRALLKHRESYACPEMEAFIRQIGRIASGMAMRQGSAADQRAVATLAREILPPARRLYYRFGRLLPKQFKTRL